MRSFLFVMRGVAALLVGAVSAANAQPALTSSLTDWGSISIFGPAVTRSGGARTEITDQLTTWDHDSNGVFNPPVDGQLVQNVWTEASVAVGGAPVFRSYHDLKGSGILLHNHVGWTGFRTNAGYGDTWTFTVPGVPVGVPVFPVFTFGVVSDLGDLFPPGGTVALPPDFYPYNPLWGSVPPGSVVVGPLPTAPTVDLYMRIDNARWYDYRTAPGNTLANIVMGGPGSLSGLPLAVDNGVPFKVDIDFIAGWRMEHGDIPGVDDRFSTNAVFDAAHSGALSAVAVYDGSGTLLEGWSLTDSQGGSITPIAVVPEPEVFVLFVVGLVGVLGMVRRRVSPTRD